MLQKWKFIIKNWINCYFNDNNTLDQNVNIESLLNIITHLRKNWNESKSSSLAAQTVEEFIVEKYSAFKFENGTVLASNEEEIYLAASLLLFFVCVNSKDMDIKSAMCSNLSREDQEVILKFSKSLMECSSVTLRDVQAAITDACGIEMGSQGTSSGHKVTETPPVLRSLHSEVRRLQAALEAERFDRNFLQEELTRTNSRMEKLLQDKEQYKLEIVDLKTKISMCCGKEDDIVSGADAHADSSAKLLKQLQEMEERLVHTQEQLDDMTYAREGYKAKVEELKLDREKWLTLSQQESSRATTLSEELESERQHVQSLRELVAELRQHNRLNRLDSSQLECDDADASIHSLQHNLSVCSEVCANVVEVQLAEERSKIAVLKQQIQSLEDQLNVLSQETETNKQSFEEILSERENEIFNLKHRINEEIEEKNNLKAHFNDEVSKLHNEMNELEQKLKDNNDSSRQTIEQKMREIQILQEEKLSLLHSLSDETTKLETIIHQLKSDIENEKQIKINMIEGYESHIMKLNEKVLNRNNELVELQNNACEKSEMIESLHIELRTEREEKQYLNENMKRLEGDFQKKAEEINMMHQNFEKRTSVLLNEVAQFKTLTYNLQEQCHDLQTTKEQLQSDLSTKTVKLDDVEKEMENIKNLFSEEQERLKHLLDEKNAIITTLQTHLQDEINFKIRLQDELQKLHAAKILLSEEKANLNTMLLKVQTDLTEKDKAIEKIGLSLKEEKLITENLSIDNTKLLEQIEKITEEFTEKNNNLDFLNKELETVKINYKSEIKEKDEIIKEINNKLCSKIVEKETLEKNISSLKTEIRNLETALNKRNNEKSQLQAKFAKQSQTVEEYENTIKTIEANLIKEKQKHEQLKQNYDSKTTKILNRLSKTEKTIKELTTNSKKALKSKEQEIIALNKEIDTHKNDIETVNNNVTLLHMEKETLLTQLNSEISYKNKLEKEYQNQCRMHDSITAELNYDMAQKKEIIHNLNAELEMARNTITEKCTEIQELKISLNETADSGRELVYQKDNLIKELNEKIKTLTKDLDLAREVINERNEDIQALRKSLAELDDTKREILYQNEIIIKELNKKIADQESLIDELELELKKAIEEKKLAVEALQKDIEQLHFTIEEDNSNHEVIVKEKDKIIDKQEQELKQRALQLESIGKDYESAKLNWEKFKMEAQENIENRDKQIIELNAQLVMLKQELNKSLKMKEELNKKVENLVQKRDEIGQRARDEISKLMESLDLQENKCMAIIHDKIVLEKQLVQEKSAHEALETEKVQMSQALKLLSHENTVLQQQLSEEKSIIQNLEKEKNLNEEKLHHEVVMTNTLLKDKESLTEKILKEKSAKELIEKEKENILIEKEALQHKFNNIVSQKDKLKNEIQKLIDQQASLEHEYKITKANLIEVLAIEKSALLEENKGLFTENEALKHQLIDQKTIQEVLSSDKELLIIEKEAVNKTLKEEKFVRDEMETEKNKLFVKFNELNAKYSVDIEQKEIELGKVTTDMKHLQVKFINQEELNKQLSSILNSGLERLVKNLKKEEITNEILQKLVLIQTSDIPASEKCDILIELANTLSNELVMMKNLAKVHENSVKNELRDVINQKEIQIFELQTEIKRLQQVTNENKIELSKQTETYTTALDNKVREMQLLQQENQSLANDLMDLKLQLEVKVHSLKEKLIDNENLTEKLKRTYEAQIDNLNIMITKLTSYLKDKTIEIETARKEKERLQQVIEENTKAIKSLEDELKTEKQNEEKLISDFESERQVLKNMVTVTESVMEDQKLALKKVIEDHLKVNETLQEENRTMKELADDERKNFVTKLCSKENELEVVFKELADVRLKYDKALKDIDVGKEMFEKDITKFNDEIKSKLNEIDILKNEIKTLSTALNKSKEDMNALERQNNELIKEKECVTNEVQSLKQKLAVLEDIEHKLQEKTQALIELQENVKLLDNQIVKLEKEKNDLLEDKLIVVEKLNATTTMMDSYIRKENEEISVLKKENINFVNVIEENKTVITNLELLTKHELEQNQQLREDAANLANHCALLKESHTKAEKQLQERQEQVVALQKEIETLQTKVNICEVDLRAKDGFISKITKDKDAFIGAISKELLEEKAMNERLQRELEIKTTTINDLRNNMDGLYNERETLKILRKENEELIKAIGQRETFAVQEKASRQKQSIEAERELRDLHHQVDNSSSDTTQSSLESSKTITDLEKIIHDKNRIITTLQTDVTYLKTLMAESETKLLDVTNDLEVSKENCQQLSSQLKKLVPLKNDEIAELKKQLAKMSATENRATQIIKVSAKYQAIILKRIAEIKTNTVLKELTNFGNTNNCDNELKRSLNSGSITMEDLENFLETTDRHLKRCTEKQILLQKERDRLIQVNKIHESEIINMKKFLTELSVSFQTFSSIKDLYAQKLSRVVSVQRTVRREILNAEGRVTDTCMCKLERGYSAVMQDLAECAMTLQRWAEWSLGRTLSPEKIKQAFMPDVDRASLSPVTFQNSGLEVQLEELENSFQKLLEEVSRALKGEGAKDPQAVTVMEVRAEYEDKLNRMKAKMKQLYTEQISVFKEKQRDEIAALENELQKARNKLAESSKAYEEHIRGLTTELWSVGEKFLIKKDEAEWLRRKHKSGSLMSLQHVHSSGLLPPQEEPCGRPSDTQSLRSLPVNKREGRGLHVSEEEGEVFDNRCLPELATPRRESLIPGQRISELQWRNSLCPPHLKSSYPAETQFTAALDENDIKCIGSVGVSEVRQQRKEVGIIAYKKPGPPTPSKQAGRLSATDSELRESLRVEAEPHPRKTSTPSRIRALFRSSKTDTTEGTPRSRRLSNIFRKK